MSAIRFLKVKTKDIFWLCFTLIGQHVNELRGKTLLVQLLPKLGENCTFWQLFAMMGWYRSMRKILIIQPRSKLGREFFFLKVVCDDGLVQIYEENSNYSTTAKTWERIVHVGSGWYEYYLYGWRKWWLCVVFILFYGTFYRKWRWMALSSGATLQVMFWEQPCLW